jgi:hypothetical protein
MVNVETVLIKLIKKKAVALDLIFVFEKQGDFFIHTFVSQAFSDRVKVHKNKLIRKNLFDIHPEEVALSRRNLYEKAWGGQEVYYQIDNSLNSDCPFYAVLSPVFENGEVIRVIGFGTPYEEIPTRIREIIA